MIVHYYEASALCHPGNPAGQAVTLEDHHRTAWQLFSGETHYPGSERPFIFRAEPLAQDRYLFMLRSGREFPHAEKRTLDLSHHATFTLEWQWVPTVSTRLSPTGEKLPRSQHIPAPRERWEALIIERMRHQGWQLAPESVLFCPIGQWQQHRNKASRQNVVVVSATVQVIDAQQAANAWLQGVSRLRAYGMGMLCQR